MYRFLCLFRYSSYIVAALLVPLRAALALDPSGTALAVVQQTSAAGPGGARPLQVEQPVYSGDVINTGAIGNAQIRFRDDTRLVVGPNSSVRVDKFVFDDTGTANEVAINLSKGALRFISGNSPHQTYRIMTNEASIGVRGTTFDATSDLSSGTEGIFVGSGIVDYCSLGKLMNCVTLYPCDAAIIGPDGTIQKIQATPANREEIEALFQNIKFEEEIGTLPGFGSNAEMCWTYQPPTIIPICSNCGGGTISESRP